MNLEAKLTIVAPDLALALNRLADALAYNRPAAPAAAPVEEPPQTPVPAPAVPVAAAPSYTLDQIGNAGAALLAADPTKRDALCALLEQFGARAVNDLKPEQRGSFATALRGLGAKL